MFDAEQFNKLFGERNNEEILTEGAKELYNVYESFIKAGFSEDQAMQIILSMILKMGG
ncbi:MAG: hypothetical protein J6Y02_13445 [Pseudobutyrivibrio sp.]|nr:hypothetical protein [Pseudobutyrivibrio sp.]